MTYFSKFPNTLYDITQPGDKVLKPIILKDIIRRVKLKDNIRINAFAYDEYDISDGERPDILAHQFYNDSNLAWVILVTNEIHDVYSEWPLTERELSLMVTKKYSGSGPYVVYGTEGGMEGYWYPVFLTAEEARNYNRLEQNGTGISHTHSFTEFPNTTFHMPGNYGQGHALSTYDNTKYTLWTSNSGPDGIHHYERPQASGDTKVHVHTEASTYQELLSTGSYTTKNSLAITNKKYEELENEKKRRIKILRPELLQEFIEEFRELIGD